MFRRNDQETQLDRAITQLELDLQMTDGDSKEYAKKVKNLEKLYVLKAKNGRPKINPDTFIIVGGNLAGILIIVVYEHGHAIGSKALSFAGKLR